jgi:hypothetical protein
LQIRLHYGRGIRADTLKLGRFQDPRFYLAAGDSSKAETRKMVGRGRGEQVYCHVAFRSRNIENPSSERIPDSLSPPVGGHYRRTKQPMIAVPLQTDGPNHRALCLGYYETRKVLRHTLERQPSPSQERFDRRSIPIISTSQAEHLAPG